jgi:hypothetical protein
MGGQGNPITASFDLRWSTSCSTSGDHVNTGASYISTSCRCKKQAPIAPWLSHYDAKEACARRHSALVHLRPWTNQKWRPGHMLIVGSCVRPEGRKRGIGEARSALGLSTPNVARGCQGIEENWALQICRALLKWRSQMVQRAGKGKQREGHQQPWQVTCTSRFQKQVSLQPDYEIWSFQKYCEIQDFQMPTFVNSI